MSEASGIGDWERRERLTAADVAGARCYVRPRRDADGSLLAVDILARGRPTRWMRTGLDGARAFAAELTNEAGPRLLDLLRGIERAGERRRRAAPPAVMGIVNVTPDSFSDGGLAAEADDAIARGRALHAAGAAIVDVGGESTRPGSSGVTAETEWQRIEPVLAALVADGIRVSVDTRKAEVMRRAAALGVPIINDVSALTHDPAALDAAAASGCEVVLMHAQGDPATMQRNPVYNDVVLDVYDRLEARIGACVAAGIPVERLIADPGIGFGKTYAQNLALLRQLGVFEGLGARLLVGASRKSFIGWLTGVETARDRLGGSIGAALFAAAQGADILRVHDVAETAQALTVQAAAATGGSKRG